MTAESTPAATPPEPSGARPALELLFVGDLMLSAPDPSRYLEPSRALLAGADIAVGHLEWPHTDRGLVRVVDFPAPRSRPRTSTRWPSAGST